MKLLTLYPAARQALHRWAAPALFIGSIGILPDESWAQAANSCNLIPNPDFELQNVSQLTGEPDNIKSPTARYDEVFGWGLVFGSQYPSSGRPTYYATNAPTGSLSNPFTNNPNTIYASPYYLIGIPFTPYQYSTNPGVHNGFISITASKNNDSPITGEDKVGTTTSFTISSGNYYASFRTYKVGGNGSYYIGMQVGGTASVKTLRPQQELGTNGVWTRVSGILDFSSLSAPMQATAALGHFPYSNDRVVTRSRFHIDEVELYKIPTAGPAVSCTGSGVAIGEGCPIPGATYEWRRSGSPNVLSTSLTTSVNITDTYTLKVTLPDNSTYSSSVAVTGCYPQPSVDGANVACQNSSITFYAKPSQSVVWNTSPSGAFNPSSGYGSSFTTTPISGTSGAVTATFIGLTGTPVITKAVTVAIGAGGGSNLELITEFGPMPNPYGAPNNYDDYCYSQNFTFSVPQANTVGATSYEWIVSGYDVHNTNEVNNYVENDGTMSFRPITTYPGVYRNVNVTCVIHYGPNCPAGESYRSLTIASQDEDGNQCVNYRPVQAIQTQVAVAYPNPVSDIIHLPSGSSDAVLRNGQGQIAGYSDNKGELNVRKLPDGFYNLQMQQNGKHVNQRIEVKH